MTALEPEVQARIDNALDRVQGSRPPWWDDLNHPAVFDRYRQPDEESWRARVRAYHALGIDICRAGEGLPRRDGPLDLDVALARMGEPPSEESLRESWLARQAELQQRFAPSTLFVATVGTGFQAVHRILGIDGFTYARFDRPGDLARLLERYHTEALHRARLLAGADLGPLVMVSDDIAGARGPVFGPDWLGRTFMPLLAAVVEALHAGGKRVIFHSDGNLVPLLDGLVAAGIDGLHPIDPRSGMDIGWVTRRYGNRLLRVGNVDVGGLVSGPRDRIEALVDVCRRNGRGSGGHFLGASAPLLPATPIAHLEAYAAACREDES